MRFVLVFKGMELCSILIISSFQTGLKLLSDSSEEDFCVAMLISLSKIAAKSTLLISTQVQVLIPFVDFICVFW